MDDIDELEDAPDGDGRLLWMVIAGFTVAVIVGVGALGKFSGTGWFGYRQFMYEGGTLYALNLGEEDVEVSVDGRAAETLEPRGFRRLDLVGGTSEVTVKKGGETERHTVTVDGSHAFLKVAGDGCLAATDVSAFYGEGKPELKILKKIGKDDRLWIPGSTNVVWPRESFPDSLPGGGGAVVWVETVGCPLLEQPEYLKTYLRVKLKQRFDRGNRKPGTGNR